MNHPPSEWEAIASALPVGRSRKIGTGCSNSPALRVSNEPTMLRAYCFACGQTSVVQKVLTMQEQLAQLASQKAEEQAVKGYWYYAPAGEKDPRSWPLLARCWPLKAGLTYPEIQQMGLTYSEALRRVIIPVGDWWQGRAIDRLTLPSEGRPPSKYLSPMREPPAGFHYGSTGPLVLTEDCLSAFKVSLCGARGWPVLGTKLPDRRLGALVKAARESGRVLLWLDPDPAGRKAAAKFTSLLEMYGVATRDVVSSKDPKLHAREEIQHELQ